MPVSDKQFRELSESVATLKAEVGVWVRVACALASLATVVGGAALGWCFHISGQVTAIAQQLKDGGNPSLVAQIKAPASPAQLKANLSTVVAQVETAKANNKPPEPAKVEALSHAVSAVVKRDPSLPEGWQAASALVSFRPASNDVLLPPSLTALVGGPKPNDADCFTKKLEVIPPPPIPAGQPANVVLSDCTLRMDAPADFLKAMDRDTPGGGGAFFAFEGVNLTLVRVHLVYRGGPLIQPDKVVMYGCTFDFDLDKQPPPRGVRLIMALLDQPLQATQTVELGAAS